MNMLDDIEFNIAKLELGEDDFLAVRTAKPITSIAAAELRARLERQIGRKVLIMDASFDLTVVSKADSKKFAKSVLA